ncbi:MAG: hypothetical protein CR997_04505 [Acidobacteria bacterium]|nr:MAG: hypothetical protein CR997_04505 [Acidobacteriota bacterium]
MKYLFIYLFIFGVGAFANQTYPEGEPVPRYLTAREKATLMKTPLKARSSDQTPVAPTLCPAEYDPTGAILLTYDGGSSWKHILDQMAAHITTTGNADVIVMADDQIEADAILANMTAAGADPQRVVPLVAQTDTIWIRDYGPRFVYEGGCRAIINHTYNRPRPADDALPEFFGHAFGHPVYDLPLIHGGGNFHLFSSASTGAGHATELILNENPDLTETQIVQYWYQYQNLNTTIEEAYPGFIDSTQHIDMWMIPVSADSVIISDWPMDSGSTQDLICDSVAQRLSLEGKTVYRVPARSVSGTHYTYTNSVICNDLVLIPLFTNTSVTAHNDEALAVWQNAVPGKTVVQIDCEELAWASGVMHCIAMHYPHFLGDTDPLVYSPADLAGQTLMSGETIELPYVSDDDKAVESVSIELSLDSGVTYQETVADGLTPFDTYSWTVPRFWSDQVRIRFSAHDIEGRTGYFTQETDFSIRYERNCPSDVYPPMQGDGNVDELDRNQMLLSWHAAEPYFDIYPFSSPIEMGDGKIDIRDILMVQNNFGGCP